MHRTTLRFSLALGLSTLLGVVGCSDDDNSNDNGNDNSNDNSNSVLCGNGVVDSAEDCDGDDVGGETCAGLGYHGGPLLCGPDCTLDVSLCEVGGWCGDGYIQEPFEQCDGTELAVQSCASLNGGYDAGDVRCTTTCTIDLDNCSLCGDGAVEGAEPCDDANEVRWDGCNSCEVVEFAVAPADATPQGPVPRIAVSPNGAVVVVYDMRTSNSGNGTSSQIMAQLYAPSGDPSGPPLAVTPMINEIHDHYAVAMDAQDHFVIVWSDPTFNELVAQRYDATGQTLGVPLVVDQLDGGTLPSMAMTGDGTFVVAWSNEDASAMDRDAIFARLYDPAGDPVTPVFRMNSDTQTEHYMPAVALSPGGGILAAWASDDGTRYDITLRRFDNTGVPESAQIQLTEAADELTSYFPSIGMASDGRAVVAWMSSNDGGMENVHITAQRISPQTTLDSTPFRVAQSVDEALVYPGVVLMEDGRFLVAWVGYSFSPGGVPIAKGIGARDFDAQGVPLGSGYMINRRPETMGYFLSVAGNAGRFAMVWSHYNWFSETSIVYAQRFTDLGQPVGVMPW